MMALDTLVVIDFEIVLSLLGLVAKEMNFAESGRLDVLEAVGLVPAQRKYVETNLTSDREAELHKNKKQIKNFNSRHFGRGKATNLVVGEFALQSFDKLGTNA